MTSYPQPPTMPGPRSQLESLELEKDSYHQSELDALAANLPSLTRLVLAGGTVGTQLAHRSTLLTHPRVQCLGLEAGRAPRLRILAPQLTSLRWGPPWDSRACCVAVLGQQVCAHLPRLPAGSLARAGGGPCRAGLCAPPPPPPPGPRPALSGTSGAAASRKYPRMRRRAVQSSRLVRRAPKGAVSMAAGEMRAAAPRSTQPAEL